MVLTLYKMNASPPVRAVRMTIDALKIPNVEYINLNIHGGEHLSQEYLKMNPQHTVPLLKDDDFVVWDSHAITAYLVATYGKDDSLYPRDPKKRAIIDQRLHFDSGVLFPALRAAVRPILGQGEKSFRPEHLQQIESAYELTEKFLTTPWIAGNKLTLADICCVATITSLNEILPIDNEKYGKITGWIQRCAQQQFYKTGNEPGLQEMRALVKSKLG